MARHMTTTHSSTDAPGVSEQVRAPLASLTKRLDGLPAWDLLLLGWILLMSLGHLTVFTYPYWTSRVLLLLLLIPVGAWSLGRLWWTGDAASRVFVVFIGALGVAALISEAPRNSLIGTGGSSQSVAFFGALGCVWAVGRFGSPAVRELAGPVLLFSLVVHLAFGLCQILLQIDSGPLATFDGRAAGLAANAVYFGALMTIGVVFAGRHVLRGHGGYWGAVLVTMSFGLSLSGSRGALIAAVVVLAGSAAKKPPIRVAVVFGSVIGGLVLAEVFSRAVYVENSLNRTVSKGADGRTEVWRYAWQAFLERPILGWGPDLFRTAIESRVSDEFVRAYDVPGVQSWSDPHNVIVGLTTGSGLIGIAAFAAFVYAAARRARGDLAACSLAMALTWLFQPLVIMTAPIAVLLLGLSAPRVESGGSPRDRSTITHVLVAVGLVAAGAVAFLDLRIQAADSLTDEAESWEWYWRDPRVASRISEEFVAATIDGEGDFSPQALEWSERAVEHQPERAIWWARLAQWRFVFGDGAGAEIAAREALQRQPNEHQAWLVLRQLALQSGDDAALERADERVCALVPSQC